MARTAADRTAKVAEARDYGRALGRNAAAHYFRGVGAGDAQKVLVLARRGELAETVFPGTIAERVPAGELARDLAVRPGTKLAADMHEAMVAEWGTAFYGRATDLAEAVLHGDLYA